MDIDFSFFLFLLGSGSTGIIMCCIATMTTIENIALTISTTKPKQSL